jgi:hypothetical protein
VTSLDISRELQENNMLVERKDLIFRAEIQEDKDMLVVIRIGSDDLYNVGFATLTIEEQTELYEILKTNLNKGQ